MQDLHSFIYPISVIPCANVNDNTAQVGSVVDLAAVLNAAGDSVGAFDGLEFITNIGSLADANATFTALVEDSDDNVTFAAVSDTFLLGTEAEASFQYDADNKARRIGYIGSKRYVRYTITPAGNSGDAYFSVSAVPCFARAAAVENNLVV